MWNIDDQYRNPNINNRDHLAGQLTRWRRAAGSRSTRTASSSPGRAKGGRPRCWTCHRWPGQDTSVVFTFKVADIGPIYPISSGLLDHLNNTTYIIKVTGLHNSIKSFPKLFTLHKCCNRILTKVNDIRPGADPVNERIKSQLVTKHGQDFKSKVVNRYLYWDDTNHLADPFYSLCHICPPFL